MRFKTTQLAQSNLKKRNQTSMPCCKKRWTSDGFNLPCFKLASLANIFQIIGATQPARRCAAKLHKMLTDRRQIKHGVKSRHFQSADIWHVQHIGDVENGRFGQPATGLLLRLPEQRNNRAGLAAFGLFGNLPFRPLYVVGRERKFSRLFFIETTHAHRSTSPNTISNEPRMADTSASIWSRLK